MNMAQYSATTRCVWAGSSLRAIRKTAIINRVGAVIGFSAYESLISRLKAT
jgi:hypothetical protein